MYDLETLPLRAVQVSLSAHLVKATSSATSTKGKHDLPPRTSIISPRSSLCLLKQLQPSCSTTKQQPFQNFLTVASLGPFPSTISTCLFSAFWNILHKLATTSSVFSIPLTSSWFSRLLSTKIQLLSNFFKLTLLLPFSVPPPFSLFALRLYCLLFLSLYENRKAVCCYIPIHSTNVLFVTIIPRSYNKILTV